MAIDDVKVSNYNYCRTTDQRKCVLYNGHDPFLCATHSKPHCSVSVLIIIMCGPQTPATKRSSKHIECLLPLLYEQNPCKQTCSWNRELINECLSYGRTAIGGLHCESSPYIFFWNSITLK